MGQALPSAPDLWVPLASDPNPNELWVLGRLRPGVSAERARAQLEPLLQQAQESLRDRFKLAAEQTEGTSGVRWTYWEYSSTLKLVRQLMTENLLLALAGGALGLLVTMRERCTRDVAEAI